MNHNIQVLIQDIDEKNTNVKFYFTNINPSDAVKKSIQDELKL